MRRRLRAANMRVSIVLKRRALRLRRERRRGPGHLRCLHHRRNPLLRGLLHAHKEVISKVVYQPQMTKASAKQAPGEVS